MFPRKDEYYSGINRLFPSCCLIASVSKRVLVHNVSYECMKMNNVQVKCISYEWFCTKTRFVTDAEGNSEMAYWTCFAGRYSWRQMRLTYTTLGLRGWWPLCSSLLSKVALCLIPRRKEEKYSTVQIWRSVLKFLNTCIWTEHTVC